MKFCNLGVETVFVAKIEDRCGEKTSAQERNENLYWSEQDAKRMVSAFIWMIRDVKKYF